MSLPTRSPRAAWAPFSRRSNRRWNAYVAIKVLRPEYASNPNYVQYFQEEARAVAALRHPNIMPIFFIGQEGNVVFFSMSYIEGETFDDWIETQPLVQ